MLVCVFHKCNHVAKVTLMQHDCKQNFQKFSMVDVQVLRRYFEPYFEVNSYLFAFNLPRTVHIKKAFSIQIEKAFAIYLRIIIVLIIFQVLS